MKDYPHNITKVYGPYTRKDGREVVVLALENGSKTTKAYARYLMEVKLGRELDPHKETVDHKNRNHLDNDPDNLSIMSRSENSAKSALRLNDIFMDCKMCGINFQLSHSQVRNTTQNKAGPFCSRSCAGKYGASVQHGIMDKIKPESIKRTYYRNDDEDSI